MSVQDRLRQIFKIPDESVRPILLGVAALLVFGVFSSWSGVPSGERALPFWIGVVILAVMLLIFAWAAWYLLLKPLPVRQRISAQPIHASYLQAIALLLGVGGYAMSVGAFWDEIWHRQFGIPFGEDFFWRPHLLMYFSIAVTTLLAFAGLYFIMRQGQGTLQQRFRANPVLGLLILVGGLHIFVLPTDPIWHAIYGEDLTAWSVPHLLLFVTFNSSILLAAAIHMTTQPYRKWGSPLQLGLSDALPLMIFAAVSLSWNQFFTTEWDGTGGIVSSRPEWLLPMMIVSGAAFMGVMANHGLRTFGAATLTGLLALMLRFALILLFNAENMMRVNAWVLALPSLLLIDVWYAYRRGLWFGAGIAAAIGVGITLITFFPVFYPLAVITNLPIAFMMLLVSAQVMSWLGATLGDYFAEANKQVQEVAGRSRLPLLTLAVTAATVAFVIIFVTTADPPL